jgi:hypothetical protein
MCRYIDQLWVDVKPEASDLPSVRKLQGLLGGDNGEVANSAEDWVHLGPAESEDRTGPELNRRRTGPSRAA